MGDLGVFQPPHMVTEGCALSLLMVEVLVVLVQPPFEGAGSQPRVRLCAPIIFPHYCSLVNNPLGEAFSPNRAFAWPASTVTARRGDILLLFGNLAIMFGDDSPHIGHAPIGNLYGIPIDDFGKGV